MKVYFRYVKNNNRFKKERRDKRWYQLYTVPWELNKAWREDFKCTHFPAETIKSIWTYFDTLIGENNYRTLTNNGKIYGCSSRTCYVAFDDPADEAFYLTWVEDEKDLDI